MGAKEQPTTKQTALPSPQQAQRASHVPLGKAPTQQGRGMVQRAIQLQQQIGNRALGQIIQRDEWDEGNLYSHFRKHGSEFGDMSEREYGELAKRVVQDGKKGRGGVQKKKIGSDIYYYDPSGNNFVVSTGGKIKTLYRPSNGSRKFDSL